MNRYSGVDLALDTVVSVEEFFYPSLSLSKLFSDLGGALGLWLGVGLMQLCFNLMDFMKYLSTFLSDKEK